MRSSKGKKAEVSPAAQAVIAGLRAGDEVSDAAFDALMPASARSYSRTHWTSVAVARRAAALLVDKPGTRVLDLGSGVGKFCLVGALTTAGHFTGIELNAGLAGVAKGLAQAHKINNVKFKVGDVFGEDWTQWQAYYLFNPFASAFTETKNGFRSQPIQGDKHTAFAEACRRRLAAAPLGTKAALYWGFGDVMAPGWRLLSLEPVGDERLELWLRDSLV